MRLGILIILGALLLGLSADAQISATLQIAVTNGNQAGLSVYCGVPSYAALQSTPNLANPTIWTNDFIGWMYSNNTFVVTSTSPQGFYRVLQNVPVFELAVFYNLDLEINPGAAMTINGPVHGNYNIYATGEGAATPLTFASRVEASQQVNLFPSPLDPVNTGFGRSSNVVFSYTNNNPLNNAGLLALDIGATNNPASILGLPPAGTIATSSTGQAYLYNEADLIVSNSATGTNYVYYQNFNSAPAHTLVPWDVTNITAHTTNIYYSFVTNVTFYDYREAKTVQAVQLNVSRFNSWLTTSKSGQLFNSLNVSGITSKGHPIDMIYFYNNVPESSTQLPAVRVFNGVELPAGGFTVATPFPLYVWGNYNTTTNGTVFSTALGDTTNTYPAALMGDAITVLSANWNDTYNFTTSLTTRSTPASTTINAATFQGIVPSNGTNYSGGLENVLRLLENWTGSSLTYNGSFAVLFQSQYATGPWPGAGTVYTAPTRRWGFDPNFSNQGRLPPGTPYVMNRANL